MADYRFHLQKYKPGSKISCPVCGKARCFTRYIDDEEEISFPDSVGICDHINSCGYHYSPKEYFQDHPEVLKMRAERPSMPRGVIRHFAFEVDDVDAYSEKCRQNGYEIFFGPKEVILGEHKNYVAFCHGPLGEDVEFFKPIC